MADRERLYTALRNADAAGDTAAAQKLAAYIKSLPASGGDAAGAAPAAPAATADAPHNFLDTLASIPGHIKEAITGDQRHTAQTDALPDWASMPELNSFSVASAKTGLGTLLSNPQETVQIIQHNFPGVKVGQDDKGNFLLQSSIDGKHYAIKPGFQVSDIPRAAGGIAAFTPAGRATTIGSAALGAAGTQAAIEASQAATGGEFNPGDVALAGLTGAAVPAVASAVRAVTPPIKALLQRARGGPNPVVAAEPAVAADPLAAASAGVADAADAAQAGAGVPSAAAPAAADAAVADSAPLVASDLTQTARKAAEGGIGSKSATRVLAEQASPDPKVVEAAKRLGIEDYLQPDHVTTNQSYRELAQAVKSIPGSEARAAELTGLEAVVKRADNLIDEIGGSHDLSGVSSDVKAALQGAHDEIKGKAGALYDEVRANVPAKSAAPADTVLNMINARADELGGIKNLSSMERMIMAKLSPRKVRVTEDVPGLPGGSAARTRVSLETRDPNYALLDDVRRDLTAAKYSRQGPFKDSDDRLITMLEGALRTDQQAAAEKFGMGATWDLAQKTASSYKGIQDDLTAIFGKNLDESLVGKLTGAVKLLPTGDISKFIKLVKATPEDMRQEVVASGLNTAFGKSAARGELSFNHYANWYEGLLKNKQAYTALMSNLPTPARKQLSDLYRVSSSISSATKERITTGRINAIKDELRPADTLAARLYSVARQSALGATVGTAVGAVAGPGAGAAVASALARGAKPEAIKAVDKLITSPEFVELAKKAAQGIQPAQRSATLRLVQSSAYKRFARAANQSHDQSTAERWVTQAMQNNNQQR